MVDREQTCKRPASHAASLYAMRQGSGQCCRLVRPEVCDLSGHSLPAPVRARESGFWFHCLGPLGVPIEITSLDPRLLALYDEELGG